MHQASVLIIDDEPSVRKMIAATLEGEGYHIHYAENGLEGLEITRIVSPEIVILDLKMPEMDGLGFLEELKPKPENPRAIIVLTGHGDVKEIEACYQAGVNSFLRKPFHLAELRGVVKNAVDLKRHAFNLDQLVQTRTKQLEEESMAKSQVLSTATHELRTPLTSMLGYVQRVLHRPDKVGPLTDRRRSYLGAAEKNALRLKALIENILDVSKVEAGNLDLDPVEVDVREQIDDILTEMEYDITEKQIEVVIDIPDDLPQVMTDPLRFSQIVTNLLSNAFKYSPEFATVTISARPADKFVQVDVIDTGVGISKTDQTKLFTKFFRADNSSTTEVPGTGLGLFIVSTLWARWAAGFGWRAKKMSEPRSALFCRPPPEPSRSRDLRRNPL